MLIIAICDDTAGTPLIITLQRADLLLVRNSHHNDVSMIVLTQKNVEPP